MRRRIDLRFILPLLVKLYFLYSTSCNVSPPPYLDQGDAFKNVLHYPILLLLVFAVVLVIVLCLSIKISINIESILLRTGDFSAAFAILLLASFIFSPPIFLLLYLVLILAFPCRKILFDLVSRLISYFHQTLQSVYTLTIIRLINHRQPQIGDTGSAQVVVEEEVILEVEDVAWGSNEA